MQTFDEFQQPRVIQDGSFQLYEENGEIILGPVPDRKNINPVVPGGVVKLTRGTIANHGIRKGIILGAVLEGLLFLGIMLYFFIGPGDVEKDLVWMIVALVAVSMLSTPFFIGMVLYDQTLRKQRIRFRRLANGNIAVKDATGGDVHLNGIPKPEYVVESTSDRDGNEVHDLFMKQEGSSYYIWSGSERDEMLRFRDSLQNQPCD